MSKIWRWLLILTPTPLMATPIAIDTSFDNAPWISARAAALSQCLSTTANGLDAFTYNPALIGGVRDKSEKPLLTHLFVPYLGNSSSPGSNDILTQQMSGESLGSPVMADELQGAWEGRRPYAALSATPVFLLNRFMLGYSYRTRTAAYLNDEDAATEKIHVDSKTLSGPFVGFSAMAPNNDFYLGISAAYLKSTEINADMDSSTFATADGRQAALATGKSSYDGMPINIGMLYRFANVVKPSVSVVVNDVGSTRYSPSDKSKETAITRERVTVGFGISPMIKTWGTLHLVIEGTDLTATELPARDKFRASSEFTMGNRYGADSGLSFRLGYTIAGLSYGAGINLGILSFQIAAFAEDIGAKSATVIERRSVVNLGINIADY